MAFPARGARRPLDAVALARLRRRLQSAAQPPWLHGEVARRMAERLVLFRRRPERIVDWGAFLGASRGALAQALPGAQLVAVEPDAERRDATAAALARPWWSPRRWAAAPTVLTAAELDAAQAAMLWSNMGLHLCQDPQAEMLRWHRALALDGILMFSTLGPGSLQSLQRAYARAGWPAPFAPFVDMHDLGDMLVEVGFADPVMDQEDITLTWPDAQALLAELRALGGNVDPRRAAGLRTPRWRQRLLDALGAECAVQGRVGLCFEVVYGHAFKAPPRVRVAAQTVVPLEDLREMARSPRRLPDGA